MEIVYKFTIQTSMVLGNEKSQLLLEMEKQVWQLLFSMVEGSDCKGNWKLDLAKLAGGPKINIL